MLGTLSHFDLAPDTATLNFGFLFPVPVECPITFGLYLCMKSGIVCVYVSVSVCVCVCVCV